MTETGWAALQQRLAMRYVSFKKRLTQYLGSANLAGDALQDTWLRLARGGDLTTVRNSDNYLYTMAVNIAHDHRRADGRYLTTSEVAILMEIPDVAPDAARTIEARSELAALMAIIDELPARQQAILVAAQIDGLPQRAIAERFGVSERFVRRELREAQAYCAERLEKLNPERFRLALRETSTHQKPLGRGARKPVGPGTVNE
jgi:RNA polymerase sigma-70 factor (ECF subfamily)